MIKCCEVCGKKLKGQQKKYCSIKCKNKSAPAKASQKRHAHSLKRKKYIETYYSDPKRRARHLKQQKDWVKKNRKHLNQYLKEYYSIPEHKEAAKLASLRYSKTEKGRAYRHNWNKTSLKSKRIFYNYRHSEKGRARNKRQHAVVRNARQKSVKPVTNTDLLNIFKRDKNTCVYCGKENLIHTGKHPNSRVPDHIVARQNPSDKFWNIPENLVTACDRCNSNKFTKDVYMFCKEEKIKVPKIVKKLIAQRKKLIESFNKKSF